MSTLPPIRESAHQEAGAMQRGSEGDIYLVRHAETTWSLSNQHTRDTDLVLTTRAEEQAS